MDKFSLNSPVTKKDFKKLEKKVGGLGKKVGGLETKVSGLEKQVKITKAEVRKLSPKIDGIRNRTWFDIENLKEEMKDEMALLRSDVAEMKDEIVGEIKIMQEESIAHQGAHDRQQETLEDHEERIASLETKKFL